MLTDFCRLAGVKRFEALFPLMPDGWAHHFDRYEWTGAVELASNHIRVSDRFSHPPLEDFDPATLTAPAVILPYQGLITNGWADPVAAGVFIEALNAFAVANWTSDLARVALVVNPHDPAGSVQKLRAHLGDARVAALAIPLMPVMLGNRAWDPVYELAEEMGLPVLIHFSGVEGAYAGAPPLAGAPHTNALSRHILMPHLAESNIASLIFEGTFYRFPRLQVLFAGFGFKWLPSLMRRMDQEWRNFRSDMPWVRDKPSVRVLTNVWASSYPVGEALDPAHWQGEFSEALRKRVVFASNAPIDPDTEAMLTEALGQEWHDRIRDNGRDFQAASAKEEAAA